MNRNRLGCTCGPSSTGTTSRRQAAQEVVAEEQVARVDPVGQPARGDRADDVEDADQREQPGRGRLGHAVVVRGRDEVGADQAVGRPAADPERQEQRPEGPAPADLAQGRQRERSPARVRRGRSAVRRTTRARRTAPRPTSQGRSRSTSRTTGTSSSEKTATTPAAQRHPGPWPAGRSAGGRSADRWSSPRRRARSPGRGAGRTTGWPRSPRRPAPSRRCPRRSGHPTGTTAARRRSSPGSARRRPRPAPAQRRPPGGCRTAPSARPRTGP